MLEIFLPFILGYLFSLLVNPLADLLQKRLKLPRGVSVIFVLILTLGILGSIVTFGAVKLFDEIRNLYIQFPVIYANAQASIQDLSDKWSVVYVDLPENIQLAFSSFTDNVSNRITDIINTKAFPIMDFAGSFAKSLPSIFIAVVVFILSAFFMVSDSETISKFIHSTVLKGREENFKELKLYIQNYIGGYIKAQLIIMSIAFLIIFTGLSILKVEYALLIALCIAVFDALPFFGSGAVLWPWAIISFINSNYKLGVGLIIIYFMIICTRQFIEPKIVSSNIGTHPVITLMSMYVGYKIFSIGGMIFGPLVMMLCISLVRAGMFDMLMSGIETAVFKLFGFRPKLPRLKKEREENN